MSLRLKTSALLAFIVALALALSGLVSLHYQEQAIKESIFQGARGMAGTTAHAIATFLDDARRDAQSVATTLPLDAFEGADLTRLELHLQSMLELNPKYENGMFILDQEGRFIADYPPHPELRGQSFAHRDYFQRTIASGRGVLGTPYRSARTGKPVLTFTGVIKNRAQQVVGLVGCSADLLSPSALGNLRNVRLGETGYIYLINSTRLMILHPSDERVLQRDVPLGANLLLDAALTGFDGVGVTLDGTPGADSEFRGFQGAGKTINSRHVPMLLALKHVPGTDWVLGVQQPQAEAFQPIAAAQSRMALIMLASLLVAALLGAILVRCITTPLTRLHRATVNIGHDLANTGSLKQDSAAARLMLRQAHGDDEIGSLARSFEELMDQLDGALAACQLAARDWARTFDSVHDAVFILDAQYRILRYNRAADQWFVRDAGRASTGNCQELIFGGMAPPDVWASIPTLAEGQHVHAEFDLPALGATFELSATPVLGGADPVGVVVVLRDITETRRAQQQIQRLAFHDALTGLPNRPLLMERMQQALVIAARQKQRFGVLFLDLDRFKYINDTYGHACGDDLLKQVAAQMTACLRENDTVARLGGDEFVLLALDLKQAQDAATVARKIIEVVCTPYQISGEPIQITTSIGIAIYPEDGADCLTLIKHADSAMYQAKEGGRNDCHFFSTVPPPTP